MTFDFNESLKGKNISMLKSSIKVLRWDQHISVHLISISYDFFTYLYFDIKCVCFCFFSIKGKKSSIFMSKKTL